jgi:hypothetical protein
MSKIDADEADKLRMREAERFKRELAGADRAAFGAMADSIKWETECQKLRAENTRLVQALETDNRRLLEETAENARLRDALSDALDICDEYASEHRAGSIAELRDALKGKGT